MKLFLDQTIFRRLQRPDAFVLRPIEGPNHIAEWPEPIELQGLKGGERRLMLEALAKQLKPYTVFDATRGCTGFGIKVTARNATVIMQRRIRTGNGSGSVIKPTIGKASDFLTLEAAREAARKMAEEIKKYRANPKQIQRDSDERDITLKSALDSYRKYLVEREDKPAKPNTLKAFDKAVKHFSPLHKKRLSELRDEHVLNLFDDMAVTRGIRTSAEQAMRWGSLSVRRAILKEGKKAVQTKTSRVFEHNPFDVLREEGKMRTRAQLEAAYEHRQIRNPLTLSETLGVWLKGICGRRSENRTGCDYLLLATLWGCRKNEALDLKWRDLIDGEEAATSSYVDLVNRLVFFKDTKNRRDHKLPLALGAYRILLERRAMAEELKGQKPWSDPWKRIYVFPTRSTSCLSKTNHYTDPRSLTFYICKDIGYTKLHVSKRKNGDIVSNEVAAVGMHDLRRTFATIVESMMSRATAKKLLNHFSRWDGKAASSDMFEAAEMSIALARGLQNTEELSDVTTAYTRAEWSRRCEAMQRIEATILRAYPKLHNQLLTPEYPALTESEPNAALLGLSREVVESETILASDVKGDE